MGGEVSEGDSSERRDEVRMRKRVHWRARPALKVHDVFITSLLSVASYVYSKPSFTFRLATRLRPFSSSPSFASLRSRVLSCT